LVVESFERYLNAKMFQGGGYKTFIDKVLAKENIGKIHDIIIKEELDRKDYLEILYLMSGEESKLLNYSGQERYILLLFFTWIRDLVNIAELIFEYRSYLTSAKPGSVGALSVRADRELKNVLHRIEFDIKFLVDVWSQISRTSLSLGGTGLLEILKNKYEITYPVASPENTVRKGFLGLGGG
jgi:hypothetical protein